jgi:MFS family permease
MGLVLLAMRVGVHESKMYHAAKQADTNNDSIQRGNFFALFTERTRFIKYLRCIFIGLPTWFMIGILIQRTASHFGPALNIQGTLLSSRAVALSYAGASIGDLLSGLLSQILKSRRKAVMLFLAHSFICVMTFCLLTNGWSNTALYALIFIMGFGRGYWAIFVTIAAEQFGTNIRATVATTVPNFARGTLVPVTFMFTELTPAVLSAPATGAILAILCFAISGYCVFSIEETFGKDLDYLEMRLVSKTETGKQEPNPSINSVP